MFDIDKVDREIELFIFDAYIAILKIKKVSSEFNNVQELLHDFRSWDSVIREFEIAGEASKYLLKKKLLNNKYQEVVDFRNQITHEYFGIDQDIIWAIIHYDLNSFQSVILDLIQSLETNIKRELINSFIEDNKHLNFIVNELKKL